MWNAAARFRLIADTFRPAYAAEAMEHARFAPGVARFALAASAALASSAAPAAQAAGPAPTLEQLARGGRFSGAVVIWSSRGPVFARGYGLADPFSGRRFTPETPVDSASLAKPVTAAAVLKLVQAGKLDLDSPVRKYLPEYPYEQGTVRQLLSHSAGLPVEQMVGPLAGKTNAMFLAEMSTRKLPTLFAPGSQFVYCNLCYTTLALLIERVSGKPYLQFVRETAALLASVTIRPARLSQWNGRAIGYRRGDGGKLERADSFENELFYGAANFSISATQLARWGSEWWKPTLAPIRSVATTPATISDRRSGMTLGNWYCAPVGRRCHYLGHHEGFHHMLYWDRDRKISVAMVSNNSLSPELQQRLQRALVAFAERRNAAAQRELTAPLPDRPVDPGTYRLATGETVQIVTRNGRTAVNRGGVTYLAFLIGKGIRYVPGLDLYVSGAEKGGLHWLSLYEDAVAGRVDAKS
jgi:CubicO group peptidase (beta-lactamase class C family)